MDIQADKPRGAWQEFPAVVAEGGCVFWREWVAIDFIRSFYDSLEGLFVRGRASAHHAGIPLDRIQLDKRPAANHCLSCFSSELLRNSRCWLPSSPVWPHTGVRSAPRFLLKSRIASFSLVVSGNASIVLRFFCSDNESVAFTVSILLRRDMKRGKFATLMKILCRLQMQTACRGFMFLACMKHVSINNRSEKHQEYLSLDQSLDGKHKQCMSTKISCPPGK